MRARARGRARYSAERGAHDEHPPRELLAGKPPAVKAEITHINTKARPQAPQIALLVPLIAALLGLFNGFRMTRLHDPEPSAAAEGTSLA